MKAKNYMILHKKAWNDFIITYMSLKSEQIRDRLVNWSINWLFDIFMFVMGLNTVEAVST